MVLAFRKLAESRQRKHAWTDSLSQTSDAVDEKILKWQYIDVFLNGADMVVEEDRSDRGGII